LSTAIFDRREKAPAPPFSTMVDDRTGTKMTRVRNVGDTMPNKWSRSDGR